LTTGCAALFAAAMAGDRNGLAAGIALVAAALAFGLTALASMRS